MRSFRQEEAFTGLEAAIVLIAFVVVAAVFSYVMLGAGFFTTQKSQAVVHTSVAQASSSVEVVGNVVGLGSADHKELTNVLFTVATTAGGSAYDIGDVLMTYTDKGGQHVIDRSTSVDRATGKITPDIPGAGEWSVETILNGNNDTLVQKGEQFLINASIPAGASAISGDQFNIELKPAVGSTLQLKRYVPPQVDNVTLLFE
ncbi:archaellin/type IV pilin N-terminal domain-containing protein [uncultured Methanofollis sp.]|uniref:archaellin/type IV pilin N-terminal domain-containing protein n=1 Tax=uncultured Methanofollis sp. TaxID=262500 RepID=UPI002604515E|nr:archaellin/type IV pilin N-terminal domain-containing protein [uncultured Methanofollis sp.]